MLATRRGLGLSLQRAAARAPVVLVAGSSSSSTGGSSTHAAATFATFTRRCSPASSNPRAGAHTAIPSPADVSSLSISQSFQTHPADLKPPIPGDDAPQAQAKAAQVSAVHSRPLSDWLASHPVYTEKELDAVQVVHHKSKSIGDRFANGLVSFSRKTFDFVTGYKHASPEAAREALRKAGIENPTLEVLRQKGYAMTVPQWMMRIIFLETVAGIPGMVGGILRHLMSLRLMRRDGGWIHTLLSEAENERMHLMTFLKIKQPSRIFRLVVLAAQGVYFNAFFLLYLISPKSAHRFVGYLEEEAVITYTQIIDEIKRGNLPEWDDSPDAQKVPQIAKDYWRLGDDCTMLDLVRAVRADEAGHRFVNHTLADLNQKEDVNPFGLKHPDATQVGQLPGLTREQSLAWSKKVEDDILNHRQEIEDAEERR